MKINYKSKTAAPWSFWLGLLAICLAFAMPSTVQAQCSTGTQYPTTTFTPVNNNLFASINGCNYAGEYAVVAVTNGNVYTFSTCAADGSNVTYDSQLTLRNNANTTTLAYSDDVCGLQSQFTWTATLTGNVRIYLHQYNCATNTTCSTIRVRRTSVAFNPCASFGTFSCGVATATNNTAGSGAWSGYGGPYGTPGQERILTFTPLVTGPHIFVTTNNAWQDLFWKPAASGCTNIGWTYVDDIFGSASNTITLTAGVPYYIMFDPEGTAAVTGTTTITCPTSCSPPTGLAAVTTGGGTSANISWTAAPGPPANGYQFAVTGSIVPPAVGTAFLGTSTSVGSLTPNTTYYLHVRSNCGGAGFSNWVTISFYTGYCIPSTSSLGEWIQDFSTTGGFTNISNLATGMSANGYGNFTAQSVSQAQGGTINFTSVEPNYPHQFAIWVDWNNDLIFANPAERVYYDATPALGRSGSFNVPGAQALGDYRMRIRSVDGIPDPCGNQTFSEAEDYTLSVVPAPTCGVPTGLAMSVTSTTSVNASWVAPGLGTVSDYEYAVTTSATPPGAGTLSGGATSAAGIAVLPNTNYYLHVRTICTGPAFTTTWNTFGPVFTGYCVPIQSTIGDYISVFNTTGAITNIANAGTLTAAYQNFTAQSVSQLAGQSINFDATYVGGSAGLNIWVDWNNNLVFEAGEKMYGSAVTAANWTGSFSVPALQVPGNYRMRVRASWNATNPPACGDAGLFGYGQTEDYTFNVATPPSCAAVTGLVATPVTVSTANLSWNPATGGTNAPVQYYYAVTTSAAAPAGGLWISNGLSTTVTGATTAPNVQNFLHVRTDCDPLMAGGDYSNWTVLSFFSGYCISTATVSNVNFISNVTTTGAAANINNTSTNTAGGYEDYTVLTPNITEYPGETFGFVAALQAPVPVGFNVWIDWNNDLDFNDFGENVATSTGYQYTGAPFNYGTSITVPLTAAPGDYRMRVRVTNNPITMPVCGNIAQGETEDYTLTVIPVPNCSSATYATTYATTTDLPLVCTGQTINFSVSPEPPLAIGVTYQLQFSATLAGPYANVGAAQSTIDFALAAASSGYYRIRIICNGTPLTLTYTPVAVSISNPVITTTTPAARCGDGSLNLAATASPAAATITWYLTAVGGAPIASGPAYTTPNLTTTTSYYVQAENQVPVSTIGNNNISVGLNNNTPFTSFWESSRSFYLIKKSELNAAGFIGGDLQSLAFDVSATGAFGQENFRIQIAHTSAINLNAGLTTTTNGAFVTVFNPATVPPPALGWRTFNFDNVFPWNGTDNIIVEVCHDSPGWGTNSSVLASLTPFNSVCGIHEDPNNLCGATTGDNITAPNNIRPNMRIGGVISLCNSARIEVIATINNEPQLTAPGNSTFAPSVGNFIPVPITASSSTVLTPVTFSPSSGIYSDALTTGVYTLGNDINGITQYVAPLSTTTYTATATASNGCTTSANFTVTVDGSGIPNDACGAIPVVVTNSMTYSSLNTLGAVTGLGFPCGGIAKEAWFVATVPASGEVHVATKRNGGSLTDITASNVALFTGICTALVNQDCNTNGGAGDYSYAHWYGMTPGTQVFIRVAGLTATGVSNGRLLMAVTSHLIWTPTNGSNFNLAENWQDGDAGAITLPIGTRSVLVPAGTPQPKLSANASVRGVNLQAPSPYFVSSGINLDGFTLNVKGNWNVGPTATSSTTLACLGLVEFNGTGATPQLITGRTTFGNLKTNNTVGGVQANGTTGVACVLTPVAGTFNANGNLVLKSTAANSAALVAPLAGTITGNASVERKIGAISGYHYLSSAVSGATVNNTVTGWRDDFTINAALDGQVFIPGNTYSLIASVWEYDETNANPNADYGWIGATGTADNITPLKGFACVVPANVTVDVLGPLNNNIIPGGYTVTRASDGKNMVGNPYASPISWSAFRGLPSNTAALSSSGYQQFLTTGGYAGAYGTFNGTVGSPASLTDKIASSQSFLVECLQPFATINALNTIRLTTAADVTASFFSGYNSVPDMIRMEVQGNGSQNEMVVYFDASSTDAYNNNFDSRVMFAPVAGVPTIYSVVENNNIAINVMGQLNLDKVVPLGVKIQTAGTYSLVATDMTSFAPSVIAYLEDTQAGTMTNLRTNPSYSVTLPVGEINNRFFLHFHPAVELNAINETCAGNDGKLVINYPTSNTVNVVIKDANGNVVNSQNNVSGLVTINNLVAGNYVAEMTFGVAPNTYSTSDFFTVAGGNAVYANLSASANTVDMGANTTVNFTATAQGATSFNWNFGDGTVVTNGPANMSHTFAQAGTYNVTFEASNGICNTVATTTVEVTNATGLTAIANSNLQVIGVGSKVTVRFGNNLEGSGNIEVINMLGEVVAHLDNVSMKGTREIEMSSIAAGQYMVKITNNNKLYTEKVYLSRQ